jgi:hypothetical protein
MTEASPGHVAWISVCLLSQICQWSVCPLSVLTARSLAMAQGPSPVSPALLRQDGERQALLQHVWKRVHARRWAASGWQAPVIQHFTW